MCVVKQHLQRKLGYESRACNTLEKDTTVIKSEDTYRNGQVLGTSATRSGTVGCRCTQRLRKGSPDVTEPKTG